MRNSIVAVIILLITVLAIGQSDDSRVPAPDLRFIQVSVDDLSGGNNNGILDPGESAILQVRIYNAGTATAWGVQGAIYCDEPGITFTGRSATFGDVKPGEFALSQAPHFAVTLATTVPCGKDLSLTFHLNAVNSEEILTVIHPMRNLPGIDMASFSEDMIVYGVENNDGAGGSVASGDINGDGYADIILGVTGGDGPSNGRSAAGEIWIIYGSILPESFVDLATPPADATVIYGPDSNDAAGQSVTSGDVNGDGYDDVILSAFGSDGPSNGRAGAGEIWVVYGSASPALSIDLATPPADTTVIYGPDESDSIGFSVTSGDINGDGYDDVAMGTIYPDGPEDDRFNAGEVWVIYGSNDPASSIDLATPPSNATVIYGAGVYDYLGIDAATGDVNGDGYEDLILGAFSSDGPGDTKDTTGEVWVIYGSASPSSSIDLASPPVNTTVIYGADDYDYAGEAVSCGDINGDGYDDVILGSHQGNGPGNGRDNAGEVWVVYGSGSPLTSIDLAVPPANTTVIFGADINDRAGSSVSSGDINGDGFEEVVLGAYWADGPLDATLSAGEIWIIYGSASPSSAIDLATPPSNARVIYGADSGDQAGDAIDLPGDINGDGYRDVIVGIGNGNGPDNGRSSSGEISVVFGEPFFRYSLRSETYTWIDATVGNDLGMTCDNCCMPVSIGFTFEFYGRTYDTLYVCDDGYLSFSPVSAPGPWNACFPDRHTPNNIIAPLWDDLNPESGGAVYSFLEGTAPNRRLTLEWSGIPHYPAVGDATFEVTLFEGINQILVQYQDTVFGSGSDSGATATAGLENITGINGQALSCYSSDLKDETAWRAVPFGAYRLYSDDMENGPNGWSGFGLWHQENSACDPYYRSPSTSWYYGQNATCTYNTGATNSNNLNVPTQSYDYYSHMDWWFRRETEGGSTTTDQSLVRLSEDAGPYNVVDQITVNDNLWHSWKTDLSSSSGSDIYMRFTFDTVDSLFNDYLGWMVDDVEIWGCDVHGSKVVLNTLAYARPAPVCETSGYLLDGSGSFAGGCGAPITYQWYEDGSAITGAASLQYTIPASHDIGTFAYILEATCPSPSLVDQSDPVSVTVVTMPGEVPETSFMLVKTAEEGIAMTWVNVAGGDLYTVYRDLDASGTFDGAVNTGHDGSTGLTIDVPGEDLVFYLVSAGNDTCGEGPKR